MAADLEAALIKGSKDAICIARVLGDTARAVGMSEVAARSGLSGENLSKVVGENGTPSLNTILRVAFAVGVRFQAAAQSRGRSRECLGP